jgi:hypothetical protein
MVANTTIDGENWNAFRPALHDFIASLPAALVETRAWQTSLLRLKVSPSRPR